MNKKLFLTSILAMVFVAPAMAQAPVLDEVPGAAPEGGGEILPGSPDRPMPCPPIQSPSGVIYDEYTPGYYTNGCNLAERCLEGHYCPGSGLAMTDIVLNLYSCPENYDNTATGLTSIEECCLDGYDSSTGLCVSEGTFPSNGLMQENKTYYNAATSTNMDGVYSGNVNAVAEYDLINYILSAGQYLPADSETPTTCLAGSYCSGIGTVQYSATANQGIQSCPTIDNATFTSVAGSSAVTSCYQEDSAMSSAELNPFTTAHLNTSVSGNGYINGVKYANATTTARRYATSTTTAGDWAALDESDLEITDLACDNGYHYKAGTALNLTSLIGITGAGVDSGYTSNSGTGSNRNEDKYGITQNGEFVVDYGSKGKIHGHAQCSTRSATDPWVGTNGAYVLQSDGTTATLPDSSGQYCYCQLDSYTPAGGTLQSLTSPWVFRYDDDDAADCANLCARSCASNLRDGSPLSLAFRVAVLGSIPQTSCAANTITINWKDVDETTAGQNDEGTATYGGDVRTPFKAETKPGKRFLGWIFSKPTEEN